MKDFKYQFIILYLFALLLFANEGTAQSQSFYFYPYQGNTNTITSYPTYTDAQNSTNAGCLTMLYTAAITNGVFLSNTGSTVGTLTPNWQNMGLANDYWGMRFYVNWNDGSASSVMTFTMEYKFGGSAIDLPISFDLFDVNSAAYTLTNSAADRAKLFIDNVSISGVTTSGTTVYPTLSNLCGSPTNYTTSPATIKGNTSCGSTLSKNPTVTFGTNVCKVILKYTPGTNYPGNIAAGSCSSGWPLLSTDNPDKQYIDISPIRTSSDCSILLPVKLMSFSGKCTSSQKILEWVSASETNNAYYTIEQSNDGIQFEEIKKVYGAHNSNKPISYSISYANENSNANYIRLKQTDLNGKTSFLQTIYLNCKEDIKGFSLSPNPATDLLAINFTASSEKNISILVLDALGQTVKKTDFYSNSGINKYLLDISDLSQGIYNIILFSEGTSSVIGKNIFCKTAN